MFKSLFTINLNQRIIAGKVSVGKFDGLHYCMVGAIGEDKVFAFEFLSSIMLSDLNIIF